MCVSVIALAAVAAIQGKGMPSNYVGIWADTEDRTYMIGSTSYAEYISADQWGVIHGIYAAPNGDYVGLWMQSKTLYARRDQDWSLAKSGWPRSIVEQYEAFGTNAISPLIPDNVRYSGEFRMKMVANGGKFELLDNKGIAERKSTMQWIGDWQQATVGGLYSDKVARLMIRESAGNTNWKVAGEFSYDGNQYMIEGERLFTRGRVDLIDPRYGSKVGFLVYGYAPSAKQVKDFRSGLWSPADQVFINFVVPKVPTVQQRLLGK